MLCKKDRLMFKCHFKALSVLVFHLLLPHFSRGVARLTGPSQPVIATLGDDIILPCNLDPAVDASGFTLEWTRPDLNPRFVHVWRDGVELVGKKHKSFEGRTSLFIDELKNGNISLKLSKVNVSDKGRYRCFIPGAETQSFAELVVASGTVSSPVIRLAGIDRDKEGVLLQCESKGWYPQPDVFWLDGEGNLLSAEPTETVRGPDDLYTVSSRVTVEKRHNNNFTCRVQQKNINQTRETHIIVSDDFFMFPFCNSAVPIITGLAVILAGIVLILTIVLFVWRKNRTNKMNYTVKSERGQNGNDNELQALSTKQKEGEELLTTPTVLEKNKGGKKKTKNTLNQQLQEEQQKRKEAENRLKTMEQELEHMKKVENKHAELQELHEVHQKKEEDLQALKEKIETTNKEGLSKEDQQKKDQAVKEVEKLKEEVETKEKELKATNEQIEEKQAEFQMLCDDVGMTKNNLPRLIEKLGTSKKDAYLKVIELKCTELQQTQDRLRNTSAELRNLEKELEKTKLKVLELQNSNKPSEEHDDPTVTSQGSVRGCVFVEFDQDSKYVRVKNFSNKDQPMGCWELQIQVDDKQPIIYTFLPSFTLKAGETVNIWPSDSDADHNVPTNLVLWKSWDPANKLLATLLCSSGEEMAKTKVNKTIEADCDHSAELIAHENHYTPGTAQLASP